ncbi:YcgN family cysteine cluster protein [Sphingomonas sp.]|uniref:YcgN family cysteine cluster protein n=1 Tax=Sphingomonas sp. TaxID=28214 RepID=UPI002C3766CD|nr:YcgN family cysteine cluster protein [Sphingomonas sp.]HTG39848.1 YcgN family cysteine cluster protein [Sphingomonas sp.]
MGAVTTGRFWEDVPLDQLDRAQWEALCDGCGKCCLHKLEDEDTGELAATNVSCRLLDRETARCSDYRNRRAYVPDCIRLTARAVMRGIAWLPSTCAYRLRGEGLALPEWHHLVCGDPDAVHRAGESVRGWTVSEQDAGDWEHHLIDRPL